MGEPEQPDPPPPPVLPDVAGYLRNMSPRVIRVQGNGTELVLPPLYEVRLTKAQLDEFDVGVLKINPYLELDTGAVDQDEINATVLGGAAWVGLIIAIVVGTVTGSWLWGGLTFVGVIIAGFLVRGAVRKGTSWTGATRWVREKTALLLVLLIGFGIPATVLLFGTGLFDNFARRRRRGPRRATQPGRHLSSPAGVVPRHRHVLSGSDVLPVRPAAPRHTAATGSCSPCSGSTRPSTRPTTGTPATASRSARRSANCDAGA